MNKALVMTGIAAAVAVVTYVTLNLVAPFVPYQETLPPLASVDSVFAGDISNAPAPPETPPAEPGIAPALAIPVEASAGETPAETEAQGADPIAAAEPAPVAEAAAAEQAAVEQAPDQPAAVEAAAVEPPAPPPPEPVAAAEPAPVVAPKAPAESAAAQAAPKQNKPPRAPQADAILPWWPKPVANGQLNLTYAGTARFASNTVVLLFDGAFADDASAGAAIELRDQSGKAVKGAWKIEAANKRMLSFKVPAKGRYTVVLKPELTDAAGKSLGKSLHGPVYVQ